jgi:biotin carboxyl carrier protein
MFKVKVNSIAEHQIIFNLQNQVIVDGKPIDWDQIEIRNDCFHVIKDNKSFNVEVVDVNYPEKSFVIRVNGNIYTIGIKDRFDDLLHSLGMDKLNSGKVPEIKAPMPGMVLDVMVQEKQSIKKGEPFLVLEAMKMENILKAPSDGVINKIFITKGSKVEKNQVLISLF